MSDEKQKYANSIKRQLKQGKLPVRHFAKSADGKLERSETRSIVKRGGRTKYINKLTWRLVGTFKELTK